MGLLSNRTHWFFILPSSTEAEERHIYDIAFGVKILLYKKVEYKDIAIIIDHAPDIKIKMIFSALDVPLPMKIYDTTQIDTLLVNNTYKNAVIFITGHGSPRGLDSDPPIKPYPLYYKFQTAAQFKRVIFYFGQCYAGIFNQMPLSTHLGLNSNSKCNMVAIGSTGLFSSVSAPITVNNITWSANIFLMYIFNWLLANDDVDGDGKLSVMDSFKFASIYTNEALKEIKKQDNIQSFIEQSNLIACIDRLYSKDIPQEEKDNIQLEIQALEKMLEIRYVIQAPWILNAQIAMSTIF